MLCGLAMLGMLQSFSFDLIRDWMNNFLFRKSAQILKMHFVVWLSLLIYFLGLIFIFDYVHLANSFTQIHTFLTGFEIQAHQLLIAVDGWMVKLSVNSLGTVKYRFIYIYRFIWSQNNKCIFNMAESEWRQPMNH